MGKPPTLSASVGHPIALGTFGAVLHLDPLDGPSIEGYATAEELVAGIPNAYRVRFANERTRRVRFLHRESVAQPERIVAIMRDLWRAGLVPETLDEFFPEDLRALPPAAE